MLSKGSLQKIWHKKSPCCFLSFWQLAKWNENILISLVDLSSFVMVFCLNVLFCHSEFICFGTTSLLRSLEDVIIVKITIIQYLKNLIHKKYSLHITRIQLGHQIDLFLICDLVSGLMGRLAFKTLSSSSTASNAVSVWIKLVSLLT